ncbi:MAG: CRISPR-associated endonuclease Cas2 [Spirochaetia bacterium]|jgi:CRISPR-associated protein Cas2|nr:CRISPR-associated endonuclease Cas2 [Spirochaetia bacterium]
MMILITYDIMTTTAKGRRRLQKVAKYCQDYGQRVQNSVFECNVDYAQLLAFRCGLLKLINEKEDSLRIYHLGKNYATKIEHYGTKVAYDPEGVILV